MNTQTGANSGRFQLAVASAVARKLGADLLVVDHKLLASVTMTTLGQPLPPSAGNSSTASDTDVQRPGGIVPYILSFFLSGGRLAFAWEALRHAW